MNASILFAAILGVTAALPAVAQDPPKLVVVVVVDQMRADYLTRFDGMFESGLAKIVSDGMSFTNVHHEHAFTQTAAGHATIVTGVHPARSGIVENTWWDRKEGRQVYAVEDLNATILGFPGDEGRSPANLLRDTAGDWLKQASPNSKVYAVAIKDRVAVTMGGLRPDGAYWYQPDAGRYVTSSYYGEDYPDWVTTFNDERPADAYILKGWHKSMPDEAYGLSREDDFVFEDDSVDAAFPHLFDVAMPDPDEYPDSIPTPEPRHYSRFRYTPYADYVTFQFARALVKNESLGSDESPDLLFVGASAADYIGHDYGPFSQEVQDYYHHLDGLLGSWIDFLDEAVGAGNYRLVLTADHGTVALPEAMARRGVDAVRFGTTEYRAQLIGGLTAGIFENMIYGQPALTNIYPFGMIIRFSGEIPGEETSEVQMKGLRKIVADSLRTAPVLADVFTYDELLEGTSDRQYFDRYLRSFHPDRAADVIFRIRENYSTPRGLPANHGSPYEYDTHVPLIVYGAGVEARNIDRYVPTISIAPTIATMLGIEPPKDLDGEVLEEFR